MQKKVHILFIILTLGFFATPTLTYACGTKTDKTENSCCKKDKAGQGHKKDCCKNHHSKNNKSDDDCGGNCGNSSCSCTTVHFAFNLPFLSGVGSKKYFAISEKLKFYDQQIHLSDGFYSIWTPPNIG